MSLNINSVFLFLEVISKGIGVAEDLQKLAERILAGEVITEAEAEKYLKDNAKALEKWKSLSIEPEDQATPEKPTQKK